MGYLYYSLDENAHMLEDPLLVELATDFANLLHDCEWMHSGDIGRGTYRKTVSEFKQKWLNGDAPNYSSVIDEKISALKTELLDMVGAAALCKDCGNFTPDKVKDYGRCPHHLGVLRHEYDLACHQYCEKGASPDAE